MKPFLLSLFFTLRLLSVDAQVHDTILITQYLKEADTLLLKRKNKEGIKKAKKALSVAEGIANKASWIARSHNRIGIGLKQQEKYEQAFEVHQLALNSLLNDKLTNTAELAETNFLLGNASAYITHINSIPYYLEALKLYQEIFEETHPKIIETYISLGSLNMFAGKLDSAEVTLKKVFDILDKNKDLDSSSLIKTVYYLGGIYLRKGDYQKALDYLLYNAPLIKNYYGPKHFVMGFNINSIGLSYLEIGKYTQALKYYKENLAIQISNFGIHHTNVGLAYEGLGETYFMLGKYNKAISFFRKGLSITSKKLGSKHASIGSLYAKLGDCFFKKEAYEEAIYYYEKSLTNKLPYWGKQHADIANDYLKIAEIKFINKDLVLTKEYVEKALYAINYHTDAYEKNLDNTLLLNILHLKGQLYTYKYKTSNIVSDLKKSYQVYLEGINYIQYMDNYLVESLSKEQLYESAYPIYEGIIGNCLELSEVEQSRKWLNQAFYYAEKSKAQIMIQTIKGNNAWKSSDVPDSLHQKNKIIKKKLSELRQALFKVEQANDDLKRDELWQKIFIQKRNYENLKSKLKQKYPKYFRLTNQESFLDAEIISQQLLPSTTILEFFEGDSTVFIFSINQLNGIQAYKVTKPTNYQAVITNLYQSLNKPINTEKRTNMSSFSNSSYQLFQLILERVIDELPTSTSKLIIIPDGLLNYIPFEVLLTKPNNLNNSPTYLVKDYTISYANATTLLKESMFSDKKQKKYKSVFGGFASEYSTAFSIKKDTLEDEPLAVLVRNGNYVLTGAILEVEKIAALLGGHAYIATGASEYNFKKEAANYQVLHLAMHSLINDKNPLFSKLLFSQNEFDSLEDNKLNAIELYNMELNAELAVLSACNTGYGKLSRGEGIMSLSRAFNYAGVPSTIMSLWKVPDRPTTQIMVDFYKNLKKGATKDSALRQAKLNWLENAKAPELRHPYYWAGFIAQGDMKNLALNTDNYSYLWGIGLFLLLLIFLFFIRKYKKTEL